MENIQIIVRYTKNGINGKDFEVFVKGLNLLRYPVEFWVVGDFPDEYREKLKFIKHWYKCKEDDIPEMLDLLHKEMIRK